MSISIVTVSSGRPTPTSRPVTLHPVSTAAPQQRRASAAVAPPAG
jgi:hypothetical protein